MARESGDLHKQYGPIVRIAPNTLAVDGSIAFPQVFQHRAGKLEWPKQRGFYHAHDEHSLIGGTQDAHRRLRRQLAHAFSDSSMYEQEPVVKKYVDMLCSQLGARAATGEAFDIVRWLNFTTFDVSLIRDFSASSTVRYTKIALNLGQIIGDLMFADSFHSLEGGDYHPWVLSIFEGVRGGARLRALLEYPFLGPFIRNFGESARLIAKDQENRSMATAKAMARKVQGEMPGGRKDFMTYMLKKNRNGTPGYTDEDILMNSPLLVMAGSETTATSLSGLFYHLGLDQNRHIYHMLVEEILAAFSSQDEIDMKTTASLPYLRAVIEENLRMFPPAAETPPRVSPGADLNGEFIPKGVSCSIALVTVEVQKLTISLQTVISVFQNSSFRNPANFADPDSFRPERWLPASHPLYNPLFANDNHDSFRPFSFGTRDCIGKNLAYSELRVIMSRLLYRFDYTLEPGQENWLDNSRVFVVWEKPGVRLTIRERNPRTKILAGKQV